MENRTYGYARVSTREQNTDRQIEALIRFGVPEQNIIVDKASGKDTEREGYQYLKRQILRRLPPARLQRCKSRLRYAQRRVVQQRNIPAVPFHPRQYGLHC